MCSFCNDLRISLTPNKRNDYEYFCVKDKTKKYFNIRLYNNGVLKYKNLINIGIGITIPWNVICDSRQLSQSKGINSINGRWFKIKYGRPFSKERYPLGALREIVK